MLRTNRCLAKFKFFLTEIQHCSDESMYSRVNELILLLVSSEISPEIFYSRIQTLTDSSLEDFHLDIVKSGLPLLQNELLLFRPQTNGQSPPLDHSSQEYMPEVNGEIGTHKYEQLDPISNQMVLKRSSSNSVGPDSGDTVLVSTASMHKMMRLVESLFPLLEELHDFSTEVLASGANKESSESESNDSAGLHGSEADSFGQDQTMSELSTPQKESQEPCKNCNRHSIFSCVCQQTSYCSAFCQDRDRDAHQREYFCTPPYQQTVILQPVVVDRSSHQPSSAPNGESTPMATNNISPNTPIQNNTSIFFQTIEMPLVSSASSTPICSITQPRK